MTANAAVTVAHDLSAGYACVGKGAADDEGAGRVDQHLEVTVQAIVCSGGDHGAAKDDAQRLRRDIFAVLTADEEGVDPVLLIVEGDLSLCIWAKVREIDATQDFQRMGGNHERQRHQLRRFIGGIAINNPLIASASQINALGDVCALLRNQAGHHIQTDVWKTDALERILRQRFEIRRMLGSDLTGNDDLVILDHTLDGHTAIWVMIQAVGDNRIGDLVANLVRMSAGHLFTGTQHIKCPLSMYGREERKKDPSGHKKRSQPREGQLRISLA